MKNKYHNNIDLVKLVIAGSVDDGKSTLIGRLFYDLDEIYDDQLEAMTKSSNKNGQAPLDLSLLTDGLITEREQKITIDVAYRYFSTSKRRYILADVPGHEQYTKNMVTGSTNSNLAIILTDSTKGLLIQSKRHLFIASLLGIPHVLVIVNKMDLVDFSQEVFEKVKQEFLDFSIKLKIADINFIPASALSGDMVVSRRDNLNWYQGPTVLNYIENLEMSSDRNLIDFRMPVQLVIRPDQNYRGYAGQIASGVIRVGEEVVILPAGKKTRVKSISLGAEKLDYAFAPQSVVLSFYDEIDASRGDVVARENNQPDISNGIEANICWLDQEPLDLKRSYFLKLNDKTVRCHIKEILYHLNIDALHREKANKLEINQIGKVIIESHDDLIFDSYVKNKSFGNFILIDELSCNTVGAGIVLASRKSKKNKLSENEHLPRKGAVLWFTGLSGAGKSTIAQRVAEILKNLNVEIESIDGDAMRQSLTSDLGFSKIDRDKNILIAGFVAGLLSRHQVLVLSTFVCPYRDHRESAKAQAQNFIEIFVNAPLSVCEKRDVKGLYQKARSGQIKDFTGIGDVYEPPISPAIELNTDTESIEECAQKVINYLEINKYI